MKRREPEFAAGESEATSLHVPRILVADDDDAIRSVVVATLREDGYAVSEVRDGGRLLVTLAREHVHETGTGLIDLLVSDVKMPVCTGLQILEQLRAAKWPVRVILMTAFADEQTRNRVHSLGALLFVKPFDLEDLRGAVARLLRREP